MVSTPVEEAWAAWHGELDAWRDAGHTATLWWRDDDAVQPSEALERLLAVHEGAAAPLCLAVVPRQAGRALAGRLATSKSGGSHICVVPHGYGHINHAPPLKKKAEFGDHRPIEVMTGEIAAGWETIRTTFSGQAIPVFVPPWNRMAPQLSSHLAACGIVGLSALGSHQWVPDVTGTTVRDVHVDIIDWRKGRRFVGEAAVLQAMIGHLRERRAAGIATSEPTGLLTHHLVHGEAIWDFLTRLFATAHQSARWLSAREVFNLKS